MKYGLPLLVILMVLAIAVPSTSASSNFGAEVSWLFTMDFVDDQVHGDLTITIEFEQPKKEPIVATLPLECITVGTLAIADEQATFSGDDYIRCAMPDLVEVVAQLTENAVLISPACYCKDTPWVEANVMLDTNPLQNEPLNPIFYRPDLRFNAPLVDSGSAAMRFQVANRLAQSTPFRLSGSSGGEALRAEFNRTALHVYEPKFIANSEILSSNPAVFQESLALSNNSTHLYIGYSPAGGIFLEGTLISLVVDPACRGYG